MVFFITVLRALAACLITNAHYTGIYPTDLIANGGLLGDVLFFAVSGYCLTSIRHSLSPKGFFSWYGKRLWRVYPPVLIMTAIYMLLGQYRLSEHPWNWWYIFPTYYHFVASIILLYIPYFFIMKIQALRSRLPLIMALIGVAWGVVYLFAYDKSHYHIDVVREPMIRFLFMESMLLGAWFRLNDGKIRNRFAALWPLGALVTLILYFASKLLFSRRAGLSNLQFLNQIALFAALYFVFRTFSALDGKLEKMPPRLQKVIRFLSGITLEIYVVQYVLIDRIRELHLFFPLNWLVLTAAILLSAWALHKLCALIYQAVDKALNGRKKA